MVVSYRAFISYNHAASQTFAKTLELAIKRYAKQVWQRPFAVFRDEKYRRLTSDLPVLIREVGDSAEFLIYVASSETAASHWVKEELEYWCADAAKLQTMVIVLTSGPIEFNARSKRIDWLTTTALPRLVSNNLEFVPAYVDLSWADQPAQQPVLVQDDKKAISTIVATLRDVDPAELSDIAIKEFHR